MKQFIGIEGGGTKFICAYGSGPNDLKERTQIKTETPEITLRNVIDYIKSVQKKVKIEAIGASIFGPLDLDLQSPTYGCITTTPKHSWINFNFVGALKKNLIFRLALILT